MGHVTSDKAVGASSGTPEQDKRLHARQHAGLRYDLLVERSQDLIYSLDAVGDILAINPAVSVFGYNPEDLIGRPMITLILARDRERVARAYGRLVEDKENCSFSQQFRISTSSKEVRLLEESCAVRFDSQGRFLLLQGICSDITGSIANRNSTSAAGDENGELKHTREVELMLANEALQKEILKRQESERVLCEREIEMEREMSTLQEANTALKVLLKRREADKHDFEDQVMHNVKELLLPYMDKLKAAASDERQKAYLSILESNLSEITAPFSRRLSIEYFDLTPAEMKVANFIRQGKRSQDMASLLGLSVRTIESYRLSIRRKMRLQNKKINLRTFLLSIR